MNEVNHLRHVFSATAWAMRHEELRGMQAALGLLSAGGAIAEHALDALKAAREVEAARRQQISASTGGAVAVLPLYGPITQRSSMWSYYFGGTTVEGFTQQLREAVANTSVTAIVIDVDSPGGSVAGVDELAAEIYAARSKKTIVAISNTLNASAAYYLSSQASELVVMPSSLTGSVGTYQAHEDDSEALKKFGIAVTLISAGKYKTEGNSYEPLSESAKAAMQSTVDGYYNLFLKAVARGRGVKADVVQNGFGEGRVLMAADAVRCGMADRIGTLDSVLAKFGVKRPISGADAESIVVVPVASAEKSALAAAALADVPEAAKKNTDDDDQNLDETGDREDNDATPCACDCASCKAGDCDGCTVDDCDAEGCGCKSATEKRNNRDPEDDPEADADAKKAAAEHQRLLALQRQRIAFALNAAASESEA